MRKANFKHARMTANNDIYEGVSVERYVEKAETSKTPIENTAPEIFTPRKDGVLPQYDIRADRWAIAQEAMDKVSASYQAKRQDWLKKINGENPSEKTSEKSTEGAA